MDESESEFITFIITSSIVFLSFLGFVYLGDKLFHIFEDFYLYGDLEDKSSERSRSLKLCREMLELIKSNQ